MEAEVQAQEGRAVIHLRFLSLSVSWEMESHSYGLNCSRVCCLQSGDSGKHVLCLPVVLWDLNQQQKTEVFSPGHQADSPASPCMAFLMKERAMCFDWSSVWMLMSWESFLAGINILSPRWYLLKLCLPSLLLATLDNDTGCHNSS